MTCLIERLLVDVGRIDLDAVLKRLIAERTREDHCERVGLLARCAPGRPRAQGGVGGATLYEVGDELACEVFPDLRIAEKPRDIDQDGVEERRKLFGVKLEVIDVLLVTVDP